VLLVLGKRGSGLPFVRYLDCYSKVAERGEKLKEKVSGGGSDVSHASQ
jgi:hypothetical protein